MDKYKRFYGIFLFIAAIIIVAFVAYKTISPQFESIQQLESDIITQQNVLRKKTEEKSNVEQKVKQLKDINQKTHKKIFSPIETDLGDDSLFFVLYNDILEMVHSNSVKIKKMDYVYNPKDDKFVEHGKGAYFVSDINLELVSNYVNLGKLIQSIYQYPYYIKINNIDIKPYLQDKSILITNISIRLYAHTDPVIEDDEKPKTTTPKKS